MFRITFSAETKEDTNDTSEVGMTLVFPEQPAWTELTDRFLDFLKSQGYVFDAGDFLGIVTTGSSAKEETLDDESEPLPWEDEPAKEEVKQRKSSGKGKKKK